MRLPEPGALRRLLAWLTVLSAIAVLALAVPGTSSAFTAVVRNSANTAASKTTFTCADGFAGDRRRSRAYFEFALDEPAGATAAADSSDATNPGTYEGANVKDVRSPTACPNDRGRPYRLDGSTSRITTSKSFADVSGSLSIAVWFKTSSQGKLVGFESDPTGDSNSYDKHLYVGSDGRLYFGVWDGSDHAIASPGTVNDGLWHQAVGTLSPTAGTTLYVDGEAVASEPSYTTAENTTGYWRIGQGRLTGWPGEPSGRWFTGSLRFAAAYPFVLSGAEISSAASIGAPADVAPAATGTCADGFATAARRSRAYFEFALDEPAGATTAADSGDAQNDGDYEQPKTDDSDAGTACPQDPGGAYRLDGSTSRITTRMLFPSITGSFSEMIWFKTTASGKLMGFESGARGTSGNYDKLLYVDADGRLVFGIHDGSPHTLTSPGKVDDGRWHHAVGTTSSSGSVLYLDGRAVDSNPAFTVAQDFDGYWRIGEGNLNGWPNPPSDYWFRGSLRFAAAYSYPLTAQEVAAEAAIGAPGTPPASSSPTPSATSSTTPSSTPSPSATADASSAAPSSTPSASTGSSSPVKAPPGTGTEPDGDGPVTQPQPEPDSIVSSE